MRLQQQKILPRTICQTEAVNTRSEINGLSLASARNNEATDDTEPNQLLERILGRDNLFKSLERVERNKGAAGVDQLTVEQLRPYLKENWIQIKASLIGGVYKPQAVKQVEIPKSSGGSRKLGIPSVVDRLI